VIREGTFVMVRGVWVGTLGYGDGQQTVTEKGTDRKGMRNERKNRGRGN
jgi:hypothetical protein